MKAFLPPLSATSPSCTCSLRIPMLLMDVKQGQNKEGKTVLYLVFKYMDIYLKKFIRSFRQFGEHILLITVKSLMYQLCKGVAFCHGHGVLHSILAFIFPFLITWQFVLEKERRGDYLGKIDLVVPHITDAIQEWIERVAMIPVDGEEGAGNFCLIHVCMVVPVLNVVGEQKTKPTHGVRLDQRTHLQPGALQLKGKLI
ncbi:hypothetical protein CRYUN_Cryun22dG0128700 [Craigia yunnanensis]